MYKASDLVDRDEDICISENVRGATIPPDRAKGLEPWTKQFKRYDNYTNKQHDVFVKMVNVLKEDSKCDKRKVGCIIVKDKHIISSGVNGTISGNENKCEDMVIECINCNAKIPRSSFKLDENELLHTRCTSCGTGHSYNSEIIDSCTVYRTRDDVLHAEENAIMNSSRQGISLVGTTAYITTAPCMRCARMLVSVGISKVVYVDGYKNNGLELLKRNDIKVVKMEI